MENEWVAVNPAARQSSNPSGNLDAVYIASSAIILTYFRDSSLKFTFKISSQRGYVDNECSLLWGLAG